MDITQTTEENLLRLKDDLLTDIKKLKGKSQKKKVVFAAKTLAKIVFIAGTVTAALLVTSRLHDESRNGNARTKTLILRMRTTQYSRCHKPGRPRLACFSVA